MSKFMAVGKSSIFLENGIGSTGQVSYENNCIE